MKLSINMLSQADSVDGQGVGSAYLELIGLLASAPELRVSINGKGNRFQINHAHTINPTYYLRMSKHSVNVAYVHFLPDTLDGSIKLPKIAFGIFKKYVTSFYKKADEIVVVNPIFIEPLEKLGIPKSRITYIPNFVDHEVFHSLDKEIIEKAKDLYELPKDRFIVLGVGQVQNRKGVLDFIEVAKKNPELFFVWAGGFSFGNITDGYKELKKVVENPPENVRFLGIVKRKDMNEIYNLADVLFMPSYNELFPMSILEAVNSKKPVLLRELDLYKDILFGKYLKASDNNGFSELLLTLKNDKEAYQKAAEDSEAISAFYSKEHVLEIWKAYYPRIYQKHKDDKGKKVPLPQD